MPRGTKNIVLEPEDIETEEVIEEPVEKPKPKKSPVELRKIPVVSAPGKAVVATEFGYDFENVHIPSDTPMSVLVESFKKRFGNPANFNEVMGLFTHAEAVINRYLIDQKKHRIRERNGIIEYGNQSFVIPSVGPEVFLRILDDQFRNNRSFKSKFLGPDEPFFLRGHQKLVNAIKLVAGK